MQSYRCIFCCKLLCILIFFCTITDVFESYAGNLQNDNSEVLIELQLLRIGWSPRQIQPVIWDVKSGDKDGESEWFSMLSFDQEDVRMSRHFDVQGILCGRPISEGGPISIQRGDQSNSSQEIRVCRHILGNNLKIEQIFTFNTSSYSFLFNVRVHNQSDAVYTVSPTDHISLLIGPGLGDQRTDGLGYAESIYSFVEPVALINSKLKRYRNHKQEISELQLSNSGTRWVGLHGRYFALLIAGVPNKAAIFPMERATIRSESNNTLNNFSSANLPELIIQLPLKNLSPGETLNWDFVVFSGPKSAKALKGNSSDFDRILFPGLWHWMRWLCFGLQWFLSKIYAIIPNWGIAVILLAVLVRVAMYPITMNVLAKQHEFIAIQKIMQPELTIIKRNFKGGDQSERILELYKKYGVSPLAGLKPLLIVIIQLPILVALFHTLGSAYELRDAPFLWIDTLALPDKLFQLGFSIPLLGEYFNLIPVLMALSTLLTMKFSPAPAADETARKRQNMLLTAMALGFLVLFYPFPSGMVLYWTIANFLHILQQKMSLKNRII